MPSSVLGGWGGVFPLSPPPMSPGQALEVFWAGPGWDIPVPVEAVLLPLHQPRMRWRGQRVQGL